MTKRITYIDILKLLGVFFILFEHTGNWCIFERTYNFVKLWICSFHIPLFFLAYGMACSEKSIFIYDDSKSESVLKFIDKRFTTLLVPYIIWSLIYASKFNSTFFIGVLYGSNQSLYAADTYQVLWFFPTFFLATLIFQIDIELSHRFLNNHIINAFFCLVCGSTSYLLSVNRGNWGRWFGFDIALTGVLYMIIGKYARRLYDYILKEKKYVISAGFLLFIPLGWLISVNNVLDGYDTNVMAWAVYGNSYILGIISACLSIFGILSICVFLHNLKFLSWIGKNSMAFICLHPLIFQLTIPFIVNHFSNDLVITLINTVITIIICIPIILFINRYCPVIVGKINSKIIIENAK